jgi:O-succinylhomoserine sulfhydrylase
MDKKLQLSTQAVRAGQARSQFQEHAEALFLTSSFVFDNAAQAQARFVGGDPGVVYSRYTNPTVSMFQDRLAALEGAEACIATSSGMSAILATAMSLLKAGDHIVCSGAVFGATVQLFTHYFGRFGVETTFVSPTKVAEWEKAVRKNTKLFFLETPSNPLTEVSDISALSAIAKKAGALLAVDNVFCTPALQRPLELGADVVLHSTTKYLGGHSDVLGGALVFAGGEQDRELAALADRVRQRRKLLGGVASPFASWLVLRGLRSLACRMAAHSATALALARALEGHPALAGVLYPGLEHHPGHAVARRQMRAFGGMLALRVAGGREAAIAVASRLELFTNATSLGGVESLVEHRASVEGAGSATPDDLLRLSVGLEHADDLLEDLLRALEA